MTTRHWFVICRLRADYGSEYAQAVEGHLASANAATFTKRNMKLQNRSSQKLFGLLVVSAAILFSGTASAQDNKFFVSTANPDGQLGALSRRPSPGEVETETADDFILTETTVISSATITGLITTATPLANIRNVEVEIYHVFPLDSANPPSGNVPARANSPADVEIDAATRDGGPGTLRFATTLLNGNFLVLNTVVNGIHKKRRRQRMQPFAVPLCGTAR
jgi:hypothetical protein